MTYDARQIANWFVARAAEDGRTLTIMSLLKLVYIAHGWHLEMHSKPLFNNKIEAWKHGPVIPDVYYEFRPQGINASKVDPDFDIPKDLALTDFLEQIYTIYGSMSPFRLSDLTHTPGGPWETATSLGGWYATIPNEIIQSHYIIKRRQDNERQKRASKAHG